MPTPEQTVFIFTHYPTESLPDRMILKIYGLYQDAASAEQAKLQAEQAYNRPAKQQRQQVEEYEEVDTYQEDTTFGGLPSKASKK